MIRTLAAATASAAFLVATVAAPPASASAYWNDYTVTAPPYITGPTQFEVIVDGPNAVCSMEFDGQVDSDGAPWMFTATPDSLNSYGYQNVDVTLCDGSGDYAAFKSRVPFALSGSVLVGSDDRVSVSNATDQNATVTVVNHAGVLKSTEPVAAQSTASVKVPTAGLKSTEHFTVAVRTEDGSLEMSFPVVAARGWSLLMGGHGGSFPACSTLTWTYNPAGQTKNRNTIRKDILRGLDILAKQTGLTFVYTDDAAAADITYEWKNLGKHGPSALGGYQWSSNGPTKGTVEFNTKNMWTLNKYAGSAAGRYGPAGRAWLVVHETMHVLGFGHVNNKKAIMNPVNYGQAKFTKGDIEGLHTLYPTANCPVR